MSGPYWKVPYSAQRKGQYATIEEVQAALPSDVQDCPWMMVFGIPVCDSLRMPQMRRCKGEKALGESGI